MPNEIFVGQMVYNQVFVVYFVFVVIVPYTVWFMFNTKEIFSKYNIKRRRNKYSRFEKDVFNTDMKRVALSMHIYIVVDFLLQLLQWKISLFVKIFEKIMIPLKIDISKIFIVQL